MLCCHVGADKAASPHLKAFTCCCFHGARIKQPPPPPLSFRWHSAVTFSREGQTAGAALFGLSLYPDAHTHTHTPSQVVAQKIKHIVALPPASRLKKSVKAFGLVRHEGSGQRAFSLWAQTFRGLAKVPPKERERESERARIKHIIRCRLCQHADLNVNRTSIRGRLAPTASFMNVNEETKKILTVLCLFFQRKILLSHFKCRKQLGLVWFYHRNVSGTSECSFSVNVLRYTINVQIQHLVTSAAQLLKQKDLKSYIYWSKIDFIYMLKCILLLCFNVKENECVQSEQSLMSDHLRRILTRKWIEKKNHYRNFSVR